MMSFCERGLLYFYNNLCEWSRSKWICYFLTGSFYFFFLYINVLFVYRVCNICVCSWYNIGCRFFIERAGLRKDISCNSFVFITVNDVDHYFVPWRFVSGWNVQIRNFFIFISRIRWTFYVYVQCFSTAVIGKKIEWVISGLLPEVTKRV